MKFTDDACVHQVAFNLPLVTDTTFFSGGNAVYRFDGGYNRDWTTDEFLAELERVDGHQQHRFRIIETPEDVCLEDCA